MNTIITSIEQSSGTLTNSVQLQSAIYTNLHTVMHRAKAPHADN